MSRVAAIQMCSSESVDENLQEAYRWIQAAAAGGAELAVLPEMFALISTQPDRKAKAEESFGSGKIQDFLAHTAKQFSITLVAGTIALKSPVTGKSRAASLVYNAQGQCVARYDKIHLFDVVLSEQEFYRESDSIDAGTQIVVVDSPVGKLGLAVCYDVRFPELFTQMFSKGAEIMSLPSAFTEKTGQAHWQVLTRARAIDNFSYLIAAAQAGVHASGRRTYGHALIVDPWGQVIAEREDPSPGVIFAEIDLAEVKRIRKAIPIGQYRGLESL